MKLKPYPEYEDSDFNWVPEVPNGWDVVKTKRFCQILTGGTPRKDNLSYWEGGNINWMTSGEVNKRRVKETNNKITKEGLLNSNARILPKNSIMIALSGQGKTKGTVAILDIPTCCSQSLGAYACDENKLHYNYLFYYLTSKYRDIRWLVGDSQREGLSLSIIGDIYTLAPSLKEQVKIGHFLDKKTSEVDLTIEKDTRLIELLKEKRTALINHVVTKGLDPTVKMMDSGVEWIGEIPEECEITRLKFFTSLFGGYAFKSNDFSDSGIQLIRIGNLYKNRLALERKPIYLPKDYSEIYPQYLLKKGDIIISMTGTVNKEDYGYTVQIGSTKPFLMNQRVGKFRVDETKINKKYFKYVLESRIFLDSLYSIPSGTKQANLSPENILNIKIYVFHLSKQQEMVEYLDEKTHQIDKTIQKIQDNISLLEEYKKSLIHHVVTGKVDVREVAV